MPIKNENPTHEEQQACEICEKIFPLSQTTSLDDGGWACASCLVEMQKDAQAGEDEPCTCELDKPCHNDTSKCDCGCPHHDKAAQASEDDAERAARDWWFGAFGKDVNKPAIAGLRNMIRARDAQAREAGRVEERNAVVRYLSVWSDSVRDNEAIDGRLQALVTDTHKSNIAKGEHITRPDRAKWKP